MLHFGQLLYDDNYVVYSRHLAICPGVRMQWIKFTLISAPALSSLVLTNIQLPRKKKTLIILFTGRQTRARVYRNGQAIRRAQGN